MYLDPPYVPVGGYSDFKRYTAGQFRETDHQRLAALCEALHGRGVSFLLTNTNSDEARALYSSFDLHVIPTRRDVNLNKAQRSKHGSSRSELRHLRPPARRARHMIRGSWP